MNIVVAETAGFCYGVKRAIDLAEDALEKYGRVYANGNIVNNKYVVEELYNKGLIVFDKIDQIKDLSNVLIRAHGVPKDEVESYEKRGCNIIDTTCPNVKRIHNIVQEYANTDYEIIIIGDNGHPEVNGIVGYSGEKVHVINKIEDVKEYKKVCVVEQTTFSKELATKIIEKIKEFSNEHIIYNTICNATSRRQNEIVELAKKMEFIIVIGDRESANSKRLYEISKEINSNTVFIQNANEIDMDKIKEYSNVGITAGASTPRIIIDEVINLFGG